jgi:hypothetical protein
LHGVKCDGNEFLDKTENVLLIIEEETEEHFPEAVCITGLHHAGTLLSCQYIWISIRPETDGDSRNHLNGAGPFLMIRVESKVLA